ncbi:hypothetical protein BKD09_16820 [Bradyrhizobium japonicum]|uniref:Serine aminopeptidase S33 domain-containing protein n=1 Tax=Bradyrhizobium japonicum TaxID=375 RepID=A0A1L3F9K4_BRAJP|nr:alpha/beta hydrolase [Bradyrhizobium japonicum]APG09990.1 hypothetical protein BKD09_16820 [Bradyrhizobium japonicum]
MPFDIFGSEFTFSGSDGMPIVAYRWSKKASPAGIVQLSHGMGEHAWRYRRVIEPVIEAGFAVYANDHRGHGKTATSPSEFGNYGAGGFDTMVGDMVEFSRVIKRENPESPLILLGHSMGSFGAQQYIINHSDLIDGVALAGSSAVDKLAEMMEQAGATVFDSFNTRFEPARTPFDWLTRDPSIVDDYAHDPLCGFILQSESMKSFYRAGQKLANIEALKKIRRDLPIYLLAGDQDPINGSLELLKLVVSRYEAAGLGNVTYDFYQGGRHEILNETNREEVYANLLAWMLSALEVRSHKSEKATS